MAKLMPKVRQLRQNLNSYIKRVTARKGREFKNSDIAKPAKKKIVPAKMALMGSKGRGDLTCLQKKIIGVKDGIR